MQMPKINKILTIFLIFNIIFLNSLFSFEPAEHVSVKDSKKKILLFFETNSIQNTLSNLKSFYFSLRKQAKTKEIEWNFLVQLVTSRIGINLLDINTLKKIGVNTRGKLGMVIYHSLQKSLQKKPVKILIPINNSKKFYTYLKRVFKQRVKKLQSPKSKIRKKTNLFFEN